MEGFSDFLNLRLKKDGTLSEQSKTIYDEAGWSHLLAWASQKLQDLAGGIGDGDISIHPVMLKQRDTVIVLSVSSCLPIRPFDGR